MDPVSRMRRGRNSFFVTTLAFGLLLALAIPGIAAHSGLPGSNFESEDGNPAVNGTAPHLDWANVSEVRKSDDPSGQDDDSFTQGADEQTPVPAVASGGIPPSKSDLKSFGVFTEADSPGFLHMFWTRVQDPSGTTNMDFEFNQKRCVEGGTGNQCTANNTTPVRTVGDVLITYNLSSGGTDVSLWLHRWTTTQQCENSQEGGSGSPAVATGCWDVGVNLTDSGDATGAINLAAIPSGAANDNLGPLDIRTFGEASVDLGAIFGDSCFAIGSAYLKSRSSDTFTSALKDFVAPAAVNISNCGSIKVVKTDDAGNNLAGVKFKLYRDDGDGVAELGTQDVQIAANGTPGAFECETTSNGTGNCEWANLTFADYWLHETFTPTGFTPPATNPRLVEVNSTTQTVVNVTNSRVPATLKVKKTDDLGNPLADAVFTLYRDNAPTGGTRGAEDTITTFTCTTAADGTCTITGILPAGQFWVVETTTPPGHTTAAERNVTLTLGQNLDITAAPFVNPRQHKIIVLVCHEGTNTLAASDVTIDSVQKTSLANGATLPDGVSEAELCGLGGAAYGGIDNHPTKSASIAVGSDAHS